MRGTNLDTVPVGFALGLREGVELHLAQLTSPMRQFVAELDRSGTLLFTAPDQSAWLRVDVALGQAVTPETSSVTVDVLQVAVDGRWSFQQGLALVVGDDTWPAQVTCGDWAGLIWVVRTGATTMRVDAAFASEAATLQTLAAPP